MAPKTKNSTGSEFEKITLVVALSQHGKSTSIRTIFELMGASAPGELVYGNGNGAATKNPFLCPSLSFSYLNHAEFWTKERIAGIDGEHREYVKSLVSSLHSEGKTSVHLEETGLPPDVDAKAMKWLRDDFILNPENKFEAKISRAPETVFRSRFLDTPGLSDSDGQDDENMTKVLDLLAKHNQSQICGVIFIVRDGQVMTGDHTKAVVRYWNQFEQLRSSFIIVHTGTTQTNEKDLAFGECYEEHCAQLKKIIVERMAKDLGKEHKEMLNRLPHVFLGALTSEERSRPPSKAKQVQPQAKRARIPVSKKVQMEDQFILWERAKGFNALLMCLKTVSPTSLQKLNYLKSPDHIRVDRMIKAACIFNQKGVKATLKNLESDLSGIVNEMAERVVNIGNQNRQLSAVNSEIGQLDTNDLILVDSRDVNKGPHWLPKSISAEGHIRCAYPAHGLSRETQCIAGHTSFQDYGLTGDDHITDWTVKFKAPAWRWIRGRMVLKVQKKIVNKSRISNLKTQKKNLSNKITELNNAQNSAKKKKSETHDKIAKFERQHRFFDELHSHCHPAKVPILDWSKLHEVYEWCHQQQEGDIDSDRLVGKYIKVAGIKKAAGLEFKE